MNFRFYLTYYLLIFIHVFSFVHSAIHSFFFPPSFGSIIHFSRIFVRMYLLVNVFTCEYHTCTSCHAYAACIPENNRNIIQFNYSLNFDCLNQPLCFWPCRHQHLRDFRSGNSILGRYCFAKKKKMRALPWNQLTSTTSYLNESGFKNMGCICIGSSLRLIPLRHQNFIQFCNKICTLANKRLIVERAFFEWQSPTSLWKFQGCGRRLWKIESPS